ncbi:sulfurtransferase complex subunit TusB [Parendozoicomonas sp. Alg238-R29]|uniref:sulfurtransferase complex subunit TusB n=1 Tax=Parendozoicomonas sp. Alg238-R29 TaxID=2993446 RepID=UPI00248DE121|nr:sulfurtransferase complex subunit TusB [Parendozoicomonas sp. Alg238-R29]
MTLLHTVNKSFSHPAGSLAEVALGQGDALLFIEDGVNSLIDGSLSAKHLATFAQQYSIYCLKADVDARGISSRLPSWVTPVSFDEFVALTEQHEKTLSWF